MALQLVIGNKNYSSWSMRPWLALRANHIAFDEVFIPLYTGDDDKKRILSFTHSGKVPALIDGDVTIWDSLAIIEYLAEGVPEARLWPEDRARHEPASAGRRHNVVGGCMRQRRAHSANLGRVPRALRQVRAVPVRSLWRRGRDVCAGGASLLHLCHSSGARGARLHEYRDVAAGLSGVDHRGPCRNPRHREIRDRVSLDGKTFGHHRGLTDASESGLNPQSGAAQLAERVWRWEFSIHWKIHRRSRAHSASSKRLWFRSC